MNTLKQVMTELKRRGSQQTRKIYLRHGATEPLFGVKIADLKAIAKQIKGQQQLACELFQTGNHDAMYLAGIVADGSQMTKKQLEAWVRATAAPMICDYTVPGVACDSKHAQDLAIKWIKSNKESIACSGWNTYAGIVATRADDELDLEEISGLLGHVVKEIGETPNLVRYTMNGFVISVGAYVKPLLKQAKVAAKKIGKVEVDLGETACKAPLATDAIAKIEAMGRVGNKRKTAKC